MIQSSETLEQVSEYASELASWKRQSRKTRCAERRTRERIDESERESLERRDVSTEPGEYEDVPVDGAYITVKETKPGYRYYDWQWRERDSWKNKYLAPVEQNEESSVNGRDL